jgi:hypothetical protein
MSSEATHSTVVIRKRNHPAQYWAFFTQEASAFWNFVDRSREDVQTQEIASHHPMTGKHLPCRAVECGRSGLCIVTSL